jgi:hypothetical protein
MHVSGTRITSAAQDLENRISAFQQELAGHGDPFGNDLVGSLIAGCYQAISGAAMKCYVSNTRAMGSQGSRVQLMAAAYGQTDSTLSGGMREALG